MATLRDEIAQLREALEDLRTELREEARLRAESVQQVATIQASPTAASIDLFTLRYRHRPKNGGNARRR